MPQIGVVFIVIMLLLILYFSQRIRSGRQVYLRNIPSLTILPSLIGRAVEGGQGIHISLGTRGITGTRTATTLAGLSVLDQLADQGCASSAPPMVTIADPLVLPAAQDSLRQAYGRHQRTDEFDIIQVEMVAPQPTIYALGTAARLQSEELAANVMLGAFGAEALLLAEPGAQKGVIQIAGTDDPQAMAMLIAAVDNPIIGEELFAIPAYLQRKPVQLASFEAQDVMRLGIIVLIVIVALFRTFAGSSLF